MARPRNENAAHLEKIRNAEDKAAQARAKANAAEAKAQLVRANVEAKGKMITYDWSKGGGVMKVVDRKK